MLKTLGRSLYEIAGRLRVGRIPLLKTLLLMIAQSLPRRLVLAHTVLGFDIWVDPSSVVGSAIVREGVWEPHVTRIMQDRARPGMTAIDIGAHAGYYAILLSILVGASGHVYAFEPDESNLRALRKNVSMNALRNVTVVPLAVSDRDGEAVMHLDAVDSGANSLLRTSGSVRQERVRTVALDTYAAQERITRVDLIKMDIEGAELLALRGMRKVVQSNPSLILFMEFTPEQKSTSGIRASGLSSELLSLGLVAFLTETMAPLDVGDVLKRGRIVDLLCIRGTQLPLAPPARVDSGAAR